MKSFTIDNIKFYTSTDILTECKMRNIFKVLGHEYKDITVEVFLYGMNYYEYVKVVCKKDGILIAIGTLLSEFLGFEKSTLGNYSLKRNYINIFIFRQKRIFVKSIFKQLKNFNKENINKMQVINEFINDFTKFKAIYILLHELEHARQSKEKRINKKMWHIFIRWRNLEYERDAIRRSELVIKKYYDEIVQLLGCRGISMEDKNDERIKFNFNLKLTE